MSNKSQSTPKAFTKSQNSQQPQLSNQSSHHTLPAAKKGSREGRDGKPLQHYSEKNLHAPNWDIPAAPPLPLPHKKRNNNRYQSNKVSQYKQNQLLIMDSVDIDGSPKVTLNQHPPGVSKQSLQEFIDNIMQLESKFSQEDSQNQPGIDDLEFPNITKAALESALVQSSFALDEEPGDPEDQLQKQISQEVLRNSSLEAQSSIKKYLRGGNKKSTKLSYNMSSAVLIQNQRNAQPKVMSKSASQNQLQPSVSVLQSRSLSIDGFDNSQGNYSQGGLRPDREDTPEGKNNNTLTLPRLPGSNPHPPPNIQQQSPDHWKLVKPQNLVFGGSTNLKISISPPPLANFSLQDIQQSPQKVAGQQRSHLFKKGGILNSLLDDKNAYAQVSQSPSVTIFSGKQIPIPPQYLPPQRAYLSATSQPSLIINPKVISHTLTGVKAKKPPKGFKSQLVYNSRNEHKYESTAANTTSNANSTIPRMSQPVFSEVQKKAFRIKNQVKNQSPELNERRSNMDLPMYEENEEEESAPNIGNVIVRKPNDERVGNGLEVFQKAFNDSKTTHENSPKNFNEEMEANMKGITGLHHLKHRQEQEVEVNLLSIKSIKKGYQSFEGSPKILTPKGKQSGGLSSTLDFTNQKMGMRGTPLGLELGTGAQMKMITKKYRIQHNLMLSASHNQMQGLGKKSLTPNKRQLPNEMTLPLIGKAYGKGSPSQPELILPKNNGLELEEAIKSSLVPQESMQSNEGPKIKIYQPTSTLTKTNRSPKLASKYLSSTEDKTHPQRVHFSDSVEVYSGKQFAPGPTPPSVVSQKKKQKERFSITSIKRILFSAQESPDRKENDLTASKGEYALEYRRMNDEKMIERHNNDMKRIQLAEALRMEQYTKKNQEIQENMAKQAHRNMNLERMKLVMSFVQGKQSEHDQKKIGHPNLLKFSKDLDSKSHYVPSLDSNAMDIALMERDANNVFMPGSPPAQSQVQHQQNQTSTSSAFNHESKASVNNVKYKLNIHLV